MNDNDPDHNHPPSHSELAAFRTQLVALRKSAEDLQAPTSDWSDEMSEIEIAIGEVIRAVDRELYGSEAA